MKATEDPRSNLLYIWILFIHNYGEFIAAESFSKPDTSTSF